MFWRKFFKKKLKKSDINPMAIDLQIKSCRDCGKHNKGVEIYSLFDWETVFKAIGYDKGTEEILVSEEQLMRIIQMVNPAQKRRKIKLISQDELMNRKCGKHDPS